MNAVFLSLLGRKKGAEAPHSQNVYNLWSIRGYPMENRICIDPYPRSRKYLAKTDESERSEMIVQLQIQHKDRSHQACVSTLNNRQKSIRSTFVMSSSANTPSMLAKRPPSAPSSAYRTKLSSP